MEIADWFANAIHRITKIDPCFIVSFIWLRQIGQRWQSHGHSRPVSILDVSLSIVRFFHNGINENVHLFQDHVHSEKFNLSILKSSKCCMLDHGYLVQCMWKSSCYWIIVPIVMNGKFNFWNHDHLVSLNVTVGEDQKVSCPKCYSHSVVQHLHYFCLTKSRQNQ